MGDRSDPIVEIETPRLRLRCVRADDAGQMSAMMTPAVSRWLAHWPTPFPVELALERIAAMRRAAADGRSLPYAIERRADGVMLGCIFVTLPDPRARVAMLGYWMGEAHQGHGFMREAAPAVIQAAFDTLAIDAIEAAAQPENEPSFAILRACGMEPAGERMVHAPSRGRDERCLVYRLARPGG